MKVEFDEILQAEQRIKRLVKQTPIFSSQTLNQWLGHDIYFKAECLQHVGAFKARGACNTIAKLAESGELPKHVVANSSGNHAQAVAWAAKQFGVSSTIYMPSYASATKAQAAREYGAEVITFDTRQEVDHHAKVHGEQTDCYWIPPYNHPDVIAGQGTAALEALKQVSNIDAVFAPCGGGGLLSGSLVATRSLAPNAKVFGVEPVAANDAVQSFRSGHLVSLDSKPETIADGVMTPSLGYITFQHVMECDDMFEVEEAAIMYWTQWLSHLLKLHIEPTSAMTMDGVVQWLKTLRSDEKKQKVMVILTGGNVSAESMSRVWQHDYLINKPSPYSTAC